MRQGNHKEIMELVSYLPSTEEELNRWVFFSLIGLPIIACVIAVARGRISTINTGFIIKFAFGGATLPVFLLLGTVIVRPENFALLPDLDVYLTIAGLGGIVVVVYSLFD